MNHHRKPSYIWVQQKGIDGNFWWSFHWIITSTSRRMNGRVAMHSFGQQTRKGRCPVEQRGRISVHNLFFIIFFRNFFMTFSWREGYEEKFMKKVMKKSLWKNSWERITKNKLWKRYNFLFSKYFFIIFFFWILVSNYLLWSFANTLFHFNSF